MNLRRPLKCSVPTRTFLREQSTVFLRRNGSRSLVTTRTICCGSQWEKLSAGGRKDRCGWLTDKYGLSWQIVPTALGRQMGDPDPAKAARVMQAMMQMDKIDIARLERLIATPPSSMP